MRIQHNIMAMNAYRNYKNNTSALSKNLERLSSGYKINRAGDDAAGLAISEKMRAQITGLEAAQKNVKDGVSLVNTAEGAMQEIQDMLNRMVSLATQSANGTYDNEVDRKNLQAEVDQLKEEINRIADSANFNGIKLLDGSLDTNADLTTKVDFKIGGDLPEVGLELGENTVLHNDKNSNDGTAFDLNLHNYSFNNSEGDVMTIMMGKTEIKVTAGATASGTALAGKDLVEAMRDPASNGLTVTIDGEEWDGTSNVMIEGKEFKVSDGSTDDSIRFTQVKAPTDETEEINGSMKVEVSAVNAATKAKYTFSIDGLTAGDQLEMDGETILTCGAQAPAATDFTNVDDYEVEVSADGKTVTLTAKTAGAEEKPSIIAYKGTSTTATATVKTAGAAGQDPTTVAGTDNLPTGVTIASGDSFTFDGTTLSDTEIPSTSSPALTKTTTNGYTLSLADDGSVTITEPTDKSALSGKTITWSGTANLASTTGTREYNDDAVAATKAEYTIDLKDWKGGDLTFGSETVAWKGNVADSITAAKTALEAEASNAYDVSVSGTTVTFTAKVAGALAPGNSGATQPPAAAPASMTFKTASDVKVTVAEAGKDSANVTFAGDYNVSTTAISNVTAGGQDRLASTWFELTEDMVTEGSKIRIGETEYTFTADKTKLADTSGNYVDISSGDLDQIAKNFTQAADGNSVYSVGHGKKDTQITVTEQVAFKNGLKDTKYDLRTEEGVEKSLGFTAGKSVKGKGLMLQIGDTSDAYNQLSVSVGDMHVSAMVDENGVSIADIDISTQEGAQKAVDVIKNAINYVSSVRGNLGAISNRLDHTANNLSVMAENITDAESTIRDTDIAEEMMAYTKNNILVQSAQAMLAQANQVPQGVLQLLQ